MFTLLARAAHGARWPILVVSVLLTVAASIWGPGIFKEVTTAGSFRVPDSESQVVNERVSEEFPESDHDVIALVEAEEGTTPEPAALREAAQQVASAFERPEVTGTTDPSTLQAPAGENPLVNEDGTAALVLLTLSGETPQERNDDFQGLRDAVAAPEGYTLSYAGAVPTEEGIGTQTKNDVTLAEAISMPLLVLVLVVVFGSLTSALLPVLVAGAATVGAFTALRLIAQQTDVSIFAITISTILALVLAVDYGLFIVSRYRDELRRGHRGLPALENTLRTAGETVAVSGLLLVLSLSLLLLFPQQFLTSMAYGGISTTLIALVFALVVLPACLAILGPRIDSLRVPGRLRASTSPADRRGGFLHRVAHTVMDHPVVVVVAVLALLVPLLVPALDLRLGSVDHRVLPPDHSVAQAASTIEEEFPGVALQPVTLLMDGMTTPDPALLNEFSQVQGIDQVTPQGAAGDTLHLQATLTDDWQSDGSVESVQALRDLPLPAGSSLQVGGMTAEMVDQTQAIKDRVPAALAILLGSMFLLLGIAFRSVLLPLKAILMNLLSVGAAFGVMVWIFQEGHLSDLLGFTATGTLDPSNLILVFAVLFGLSMDYEVFMLSRIKEEYDATGDNRYAVATGLQATSGIITAAAALLLIVVGAFSFSGISFIKMIGVGMLVAITIDVVLIRGLLVPATMRLLGRWNWWPGNRGQHAVRSD